jgi:hypothetical protein
VNRDGNTNYIRLKVKMKTATHTAMKEYGMRRWNCKEQYKKTKELGWKENDTIQITGIKESQVDIMVDQKLSLGELYYRALKSTYQGIKEIREKKLQEFMLYLRINSEFWGIVSDKGNN